MFKMEYAFLQLLKNNILYNNTLIPVVRRNLPLDFTPCITISQADEVFIKREYADINKKQYLKKTYSADIWINIWCTTEEERQSIIEQIETIILEAESNHYKHCKHYNKSTHICETLNSECEARTINNGRTIKHQCPDKVENDYTSFFMNYNIYKNTFKIQSITNMDELETTQPILRTIFKLGMEYWKFHEIGGTTYNSFEISEELL